MPRASIASLINAVVARVARVAVVAVVAACSPGTGGPTRAPDPRPAPGATAPSTAPPTDRECDNLFAHAIAIRVSEQRQALPPEQVPTEDDQVALRAELRGSFLESCRAGGREAYECGLAARTLGELAACHSTRSSSTSNSSVAPGGMTPPAPLAP